MTSPLFFSHFLLTRSHPHTSSCQSQSCAKQDNRVNFVYDYRAEPSSSRLIGKCSKASQSSYYPNCALLLFFLFFFFKLTHNGSLVSGASDDAVSCAVMLEVLHSLANQSTPLRHGVIFLFNGAEENILQVKVYRRFTLHTLHSFELSFSADLFLNLFVYYRFPSGQPWLHYPASLGQTGASLH